MAKMQATSLHSAHLLDHRSLELQVLFLPGPQVQMGAWGGRGKVRSSPHLLMPGSCPEPEPPPRPPGSGEGPGRREVPVPHAPVRNSLPKKGGSRCAGCPHMEPQAQHLSSWLRGRTGERAGVLPEPALAHSNPLRKQTPHPV